MRNLKSSVPALTLGAILSTTLILGGCGEKNKGENVKIEKVASRNVDANEAEKALKLMALYESGAGDVAWSDRKGDNGNYIFSNFENDSNDGDKGIFGSLELKGLHMEGKTVAFDQMVFNDFLGTDDEAKITIANITLTEPSPALAAAIARSFNGDDDAFENMEGGVNFKALSFSGLKVDDEDGVLSMAGLKVGKDKNETGYFSLSDLNMDMMSEGEKVIMSLGSIDVTGVNIAKYQGLIKAAMDNDGKVDADAMKELMGSINAYDPDFKDFSLKNFNMDVLGLKMNLDSMTGKAEKKGSKVIMSQTMSPLTIMPPVGSTNKDMKKITEGLTSFGYDKLEFTMEQNSVLDEENDTMVVKDSYIQMKDGFKLSYDYDIAGYKKFAEKAMSLQGGKSKNPMAAMSMMNELKFNNLRLALKDDSIIDRSFQYAAAQQGGKPEDLRQQAKMGLAFLPMMAKNEGQQKLAEDLSKALGKLLDDGGTLVVGLNPKEAVDFGTIMQGGMNGQIDIDALGLTIEAE
jgi:hypothetical protein